MRSWRLDGAVVFAVLLAALLIYGLTTLHLIPVYKPFWGLDFHNVFVFHHCELSSGGLYATTGTTCGDVLDRNFLYPPALFWLMAWVRSLSFGAAVTTWNVFTSVAALGVGAGWLALDHRLRRGWRTAVLSVLWLALLVQFPFVFGLERGNNDILPLLLWTGAALVHASGRSRLSGAIAGVAVAVKVYPAVALLVVTAGLVRASARTAVAFVAAAVAGGLVVSVFWLDDTIRYLTDVLPEFAARTRELTTISHALDSMPSPRWLILALGVGLLGSWVLAAWIRLTDDPAIVFAGALAVSTYFSTTSWDYNLITTYPLIVLAAARALEPGAFAWRLATLGTAFAVLAGRGVLDPLPQLLIQVIVLAATAMLVVREGVTSRSADARPAGVHTG